MANLFNVANAPTKEPEKIVIGDFVQWKREDLVSDYPVATHSAVWIAKSAEGAASEITINATEASTYYLFTAASATSASWNAGQYHWQLEIIQTSSSNRIVVDRGSLEILVDLDVSGADSRTHAQIMVQKIESILEGKADADVSSYSIAGRSLTKMSFEELIAARDFYRKEHIKELAIERAENGETTGKTILVRF